MTKADKYIAIAFVAAVTYSAVATSLGLLGFPLRGPIDRAISTFFLIAFLVTIAVLFVLIWRRLLKSDRSKASKVLWCVVLLFTNIFGAAAFFAYDVWSKASRVQGRESVNENY